MIRTIKNALATIIITVVGICVVIAGWLMLQQERQRKQDLQLKTGLATR